MTNYLQNFVGKEVNIYPGDTHAKRGIVRQITDVGVVFEITYTAAGVGSGYVVGTLHFISFASKLTFAEVLKD